MSSTRPVHQHIYHFNTPVLWHRFVNTHTFLTYNTNNTGTVSSAILPKETNIYASFKENIQFKCQGSFTLRIGEMAKYTEDTKENTDLHQQMHAQNPTPEVDRQGTQHYTLENDQATTHKKGNKKGKMDLDRTYTQETTRNNHPSSHHMEPPSPREEEKR